MSLSLKIDLTILVIIAVNLVIGLTVAFVGTDGAKTTKGANRCIYYGIFSIVLLIAGIIYAAIVFIWHLY